MIDGKFESAGGSRMEGLDGDGVEGMMGIAGRIAQEYIIEILTDSPTLRQYWGKIKDREFAQLELFPIWVQLKLPAEDGKLRFTDCINTHQ